MDIQSHRSQLILTALAASATSVAAFSAYQAWDRRRRRDDLREDVLRSLKSRAPLRSPESEQDADDEDDEGISTLDKRARKEAEARPLPVDGYAYDEELVREQLARNYAFFGEEGMRKLRGASVVIVGCGGVGSWAAVMLARSGVAKIRLVDFDYVTLSSLNRHATAGLADVGTPKVKCVERALKQFSRWIDVDARVDLWRKEEGGELLDGYDWVVDAIDNITTKVDLLAYCTKHNLRVISSMGAGAKSDPTRIQIADIANTVYDPLARSVRRKLRAVHNVASGIPVVYSTEVPGDVKLLPLPEEEFQKGAVHELGALDDFRVRILPVLGPLPAIFGLNIATYVLCEMAGKPIANPLPIKNRRKLYERLLRELAVRESKVAGEPDIVRKMPLDEEDVSLIIEDVHTGRSVLPPHLVPTRPAIVRWDPSQPLTPENVVFMELNDADRHTRETTGVDLSPAGRQKKKPFVMAKEQITPGSELDAPLVPPEESGVREKTPAEVWGEEVDAIVRGRAAYFERWRKEVIQ